jgi:hypothetical protein
MLVIPPFYILELMHDERSSALLHRSQKILFASRNVTPSARTNGASPSLVKPPAIYILAGKASSIRWLALFVIHTKVATRHDMTSKGTATVPEVALRSGSAKPMPVVGMGTAVVTVEHETTKDAVVAAIEVGYRHFDTAWVYGTEKPLGDAVAEAVRRGLIRSRDEVFVTSKLWCSQCHADLVLPSLRETLQ